MSNTERRMSNTEVLNIEVLNVKHRTPNTEVLNIERRMSNTEVLNTEVLNVEQSNIERRTPKC